MINDHYRFVFIVTRKDFKTAIVKRQKGGEANNKMLDGSLVLRISDDKLKRMVETFLSNIILRYAV